MSTVTHDRERARRREEAHAEPARVPAAALLDRVGNRGLAALRAYQAKSAISTSDDPLELLADRAADKVVAEPPAAVGPAPPPANEPSSAAGPEVLREAQPDTPGPPAAPAPPRPGGGPSPHGPVASQLLSGLDAGTPLPGDVRRFMEGRFGRSFADVRVHTGEEAARAAESVSARAATVGSEIVFGAGEYAPESHEGRRLLAHELAHVVQQGADGGTPAPEAVTEVEADDAAHSVVEGRAPEVSERATPGDLQRSPEDAPALDRRLYEGVRNHDHKSAAEALNSFSPDDIALRLSADPGSGRRVLTRAEVASIHFAALEHPGLGAGSNAARFSRPAFLDVNVDNEMRRGSWQVAAELMNDFSDPDMNVRLRRLSIDQLRLLQLGALQNPRLGAGSAVAKNSDAAIKVATRALVERSVHEGAVSGDLRLPTSNAGTGPPGSTSSISIGGKAGNSAVGVPVRDRELLPSDTDWSRDPMYIDNGIVSVSYGIYTGLFRIQYADGTFLDLDLDQVRVGFGGTVVVPQFFRYRGRIYPTTFSTATIPTISWCAKDITRQEPGFYAGSLDMWITIAVAAQGAAGSAIRVSQALARSGSAARPTGKGTGSEPEGGSGTGASARGARPSRMGGEPQAGQGSGLPGAADQPGGGLRMSPSGAARGTTPRTARHLGQGDLSEVTMPRSAPRTLPPPTDLPPEAWRFGRIAGEGFGVAFKATAAAVGKVVRAGQDLGEGRYLAAEQGARVVAAATRVVEGPVSVGALQLGRVLLVTGGQVVMGAAATVGRPLVGAIATKNVVYLVLGPESPGSDQPVSAPGAEATPAKAPGTGEAPVVAPGRAPASSVTDPVKHLPAQAPGLVDDPLECAKQIQTKVDHDHHVFPQKYRFTFEWLGIDIDEFTITMGWAEHVGKNGVHAAMGWNNEWDEFFDDLPDLAGMTKAVAKSWQLKAKDLGFRLMVEAGIDRRKLHRYRK